MIKQLRRKFLLVTMAAVFIVVMLLMVAINVVYDVRMERRSDVLIDYLSENRGVFPNARGDLSQRYDQFTEETRFETRFFSFVFNEDGEIVDSHLDAVAAITDEEAENYAREVYDGQRVRGYKKDYKFQVTKKGEETLIVFLDCFADRQEEQAFLFSCLIIVASSLALIYLLAYLFSNKAIRPTVESMEKQKQFITDAGHEIKTPLAIITANTEVLELTQGENEWTTSIKHQAGRLNDLIQQMLTLARLQEMSDKEQFVQADVSKIIMDELVPFETLAESKGKHLELQIQEQILCKYDENGIRRLASILTENAIKYAQEESTIKVFLSEKGKRIRLEVRNMYPGAQEDQLRNVFRRFYRTDKSRARETGGFGIGLSIAHAIVLGHKGRIVATVPEKDVVSFVAVWPKNL